MSAVVEERNLERQLRLSSFHLVVFFPTAESIDLPTAGNTQGT